MSSTESNQLYQLSIGLFSGFSLGVVTVQDSQKQCVSVSGNSVARDLLNTKMDLDKGLAVRQYRSVASHIASSEGLDRIIALQEKQIHLGLPHFSLHFSWNSSLFSSFSKLRYKDYEIEKTAALYECTSKTIVVKTTYFCDNWSSVILCHLDHWSITCTQKDSFKSFVAFPSKSFRELNVKVWIFFLTLYMYIIFSVWLKHCSELIGKCTVVALELNFQLWTHFSAVFEDVPCNSFSWNELRPVI